MAQQKVQLYKIRDFGAKINVTIEYIRHNLVPLLKVVLLIVAPLGLIFGILISNLFQTFFQFSINQNNMEADPLGMMGILGTNYLIMIFLSILTMALMLSVIYGYMKMNDMQEERPTPTEVFQKMLPRLPMLIVLIILISIVSFVGFFLFILPGLYLMITLSLAVPIYIFEDESLGNSFFKSFKLISNKWWSTFGLIIVTGLIASVLSYIFLIPMYVLMVGSMITTMSESGNDPEAIFSVFNSWYTVVGMTIVMIGAYVTYLVPIIAVGFQYFNLSERVEGRGIRNQIKDFETV